MTGIVDAASTQDVLDELRTAVRDFLRVKSDEQAVRRLMDSEPRFDPAVWAQASEQLRLPGLAVPEQYGGDGFGLVELGVVLEEMGRALYCGPFLSSAVLAANALLAADDPTAASRYLPDIAAGTATAALAVAEDSGSWQPDGLSTRAVDHAGSGCWSLTGRKSFVVDGATADTLLVIGRTAAGLSLFAVDRRAAGVTAATMRSLDATRALALVSLHEAPATLVGGDGAGVRILERVLDVACAAVAAEQAGAARACLESAAEYARTRYQFGRPIGSFQAVKHKCADMLVQVELAEASAREAARLHDEQRGDFPSAAAAAYLSCSRGYLFAAMENIQVHGGVGFTWEHSAHLHFRRAKSAQLLFGGPSEASERLLDRLGIGGM